MGYNLLINGIHWGHNPFTNHLLTSWNIQVQYSFVKELHRVLEGLYFLDGMNPRKSKILWEIIDRAGCKYI